jgi:hypothetical protein
LKSPLSQSWSERRRAPIHGEGIDRAALQRQRSATHSTSMHNLESGNVRVGRTFLSDDFDLAHHCRGRPALQRQI